MHSASLNIDLVGWQRTVICIFAAALLIRIAFILTLQEGFYFYDSVDYTAAAENPITRGELGEAYRRSPAYPVFLAGIYLLFGQAILTIRLVEALLGACLVVVVAVIGRRIAGERGGMLAGGLWTLYPNAIFIAGLVYPTGLATMLLACAVLCLVTEADQAVTPGRAMLGGILVGLAALTVPVALVTAAALALWVIYWQRTHRFFLAALVLLGVALPLAPWMVRNYEVYGRFVLIEPRLVQHLPGARRLQAVQSPQQDGTTLRQSEDKIEVILTHPEAFARCYLREFSKFWELYPTRVAMNRAAFREYLHGKDDHIVETTVFGTSWTSLVSILSVGPTFLFALIGSAAMCVQKARRGALTLLCSVILSFALTYAFFFGKMRYRVPIEPYIVVLNAYGLASTRLVLASDKRLIASAWSGRSRRST